MAAPDTVWVFGDQLNRNIGALANATPDTHRVLMVIARNKVQSRRWHVQRLHLIVTAMRRFADELRYEGFDVDVRVTDTMAAGLHEHVTAHALGKVVATEPNSLGARAMLSRLGVDTVRSTQFLCHPEEFAAWLGDRTKVRMEDFYRWQRRRFDVLMDDGEPAGGEWNFDADNRERPPKDGHDRWPSPVRYAVRDEDVAFVASLGADTFGASPDGTWPTTRAEALQRLDQFIDDVLPMFGPHEDAMLADNWHLAHSALSPALNLGLLLPEEVVRRAEAAYRAGRVPIASAEGFIRQIIGWREYVWNLYWKWMPDYGQMNELDAQMPLPPLFDGRAATSMRCVSGIIADINARGWVHHIPRLMVLGNLALIAGVNPQRFTDWMWESFVDGAEWVMIPNVIGMSLHADGGMMATKPYAAGGAYIDRMSNYCKGCRYDRTKRVGDDACPFTTLYWDFLLRHEERFVRNPRIATQVRAARKLSDIDDTRRRGADVLRLLANGEL